MISRFQSLSSPMKGLVILAILAFSSLGWYLGSPLFLPGDELNDDLASDSTGSILFTGMLEKMDDAHWGEGTVNIVNVSNSLKLEFVDVNIANGPSLVVYLSDSDSFSSIYDDPGTYLDLGALPAQKGNFSMVIPDSTDISPYMSVLIWCEPFTVVFSFASLSVSSLLTNFFISPF